MRSSGAEQMKADLAVAIDKTRVQPGENLDIHVEVIPKKKKKKLLIRRVKVELIRVETYVRARSDDYSTDYCKRVVEKSMSETTSLEAEKVKGPDTVSADVKLTVPSDSLPTVNGHRIHGVLPGITWKLHITLNMHHAKNIQIAEDITVFKASGLETSQPIPVVVESKHRKCQLHLSISRVNLYSDCTFEGTLQARILKKINAQDVRIELVRVEKFGGEKHIVTVAQASVEEYPVLSAGDTRLWPFEMSVGKISVPSLKTNKSYVKWSVIARLDVAMRKDPKVSKEVNVDI